MSSELRRFPRVRVKAALAELIVGLGAQLTWPNLEVSEILDLSYKGLAARRPGLFPIAITNEVVVDLRLGNATPFVAGGRVAWCNLDWVGLELTRLSSEAHQAMAQYLDYKLRGSALRPIERVFFSSGHTFHRWYQAPGGIHVFVWEKELGQFERVDIEVDGRTLSFNRGQPLEREPSPSAQRALLILSQMPNPEMEQFMRTLQPVSGRS